LVGLGLKIVQVRYEVVTAVSVDILGCCTVWSSPVGIDMRFRGAYCLHHQGSECGEFLKCFKNVQVKMVSLLWVPLKYENTVVVREIHYDARSCPFITLDFHDTECDHAPHRLRMFYNF
jgi:hypothetical protein